MTHTIGIIVGEFHKQLADEMLAHAQSLAPGLNATIEDVIWVPGSFEIPFVLNEMLKTNNYDAIVILGYIEKGETLHGEVMAHQVIKKIIDLELHFQKPVGIGIIGPGATMEQAEVRTKGSAEKAMKAAIKLLKIKDQMRKYGARQKEKKTRRIDK